jgi:putative flippase GtrA
MKIVSDPVERTRFLKFLVVGMLGAVIDFSVMNVLSHFVHLQLVAAGTISFVCAVISNFLWNRYWVYPDSRSRQASRQLAMFFAVNITGVLVRIPILHFIEPLIVDMLEDACRALGLPVETLAKNLTLALAVGVVLLWNFFVNRYWTYNDVDKAVT